MSTGIRPAVPADAPVIHGLVRALARYENLEDTVEASEADIAAALFGPAPRVFCDLAEADGAVAGFALWYYSYSSFVGRHGIYLEDLYVEPAFRGRGLGKALVLNLARRCVAQNLGRLEWSVLDWNAPAIQFYRAQGARLLDDWTTCRVDGSALRALGGTEHASPGLAGGGT